MCVRHERTGKILNKGETIVPGVGVVMLEQNLHTAARTGRIFQTTDKILETTFHPDLHSIDLYAVDEKIAADAKERNMERLRQFCHAEGLAWPQKIHIGNSGKNPYEKRSLLGDSNGKLCRSRSRQQMYSK
jgi:hypothetical protein